MKLHLGCADKYLEGYQHMDIRKINEKIDYIGSADNLSQFSDNSIDELYACHLLEHFKRYEIDKVLKEWYRVLKGGILRIAVPDFEAIMEVYNTSGEINKVLGLLYGGQNYEYNFHHITFDFKYIKEKLMECDFCNIERYDWKQFLPPGYDDFSRAYIPHMDFTNGRLMSLNVIAKK